MVFGLKKLKLIGGIGYCPQTYNIDTTKIEQAITPNTCAILAINLLGNPCDFDALYKIADKHNLFVIEDNCESMGAKYNNRYTGGHGIIGTQSFSFHITYRQWKAAWSLWTIKKMLIGCVH